VVHPLVRKHLPAGKIFFLSTTRLDRITLKENGLSDLAWNMLIRCRKHDGMTHRGRSACAAALRNTVAALFLVIPNAILAQKDD
jgi:hypothetical protein